ncbi:MAG: hypothetical protein N2690_07325 [Rhodocyclaceae bacterium]|nr:hypothetical protein [Rhodocyclaceae bacterium]
MIPSYTTSYERLAAADAGPNRTIEASGAYIGSLTYARAVQSSKGAWGVELGFVTDAGLSPRYPLTLWTLSPEGKRYFGHDLLDALLVCAGFAQGAQLRPGKVRYPRWDEQAGCEVLATAEGYPELAGRRVGLLLQRELYTTKAGKEGSRLSIVGVFDAQTQQTASEKQAGLPPKLLMERLARLQDKDSRSAAALPEPAVREDAASAFADMADDIPF